MQKQDAAAQKQKAGMRKRSSTSSMDDVEAKTSLSIMCASPSNERLRAPSVEGDGDSSATSSDDEDSSPLAAGSDNPNTGVLLYLCPPNSDYLICCTCANEQELFEWKVALL